MSHSSRIKFRSLHSSLQIIGSSFLGLGLLFILSHKVKWNKSIIPSTIHSTLGFCCLAVIVLQVFAGFEKVENLEKNNTKSRRWHGDLGMFFLDFLMHLSTCRHTSLCLDHEFLFFCIINRPGFMGLSDLNCSHWMLVLFCVF